MLFQAPTGCLRTRVYIQYFRRDETYYIRCGKSTEATKLLALKLDVGLVGYTVLEKLRKIWTTTSAEGHLRKKLLDIGAGQRNLATVRGQGREVAELKISNYVRGTQLMLKKNSAILFP